jgi:hypothetical protein
MISFRRAVGLSCLLFFLNPLMSQAKPLADDLCNYEAEGLMLRSSKAEVDAKFQALGWGDYSQEYNNWRSGKLEKRYIYIQSPPETPPKDNVGFRTQRGNSSFSLHIFDGEPRQLIYARSYATREEAIASDMFERAENFCTISDQRFVIYGCNRLNPNSKRSWHLISLMLTVETEAAHCEVRYEARNGDGYKYSVTRLTADQARDIYKKNQLSRQ